MTGGMTKRIRQVPGSTTQVAVDHRAMAKPARRKGARVLIVNCPIWIMIPKMPAKVPRSVRLNQAALILTMPGAPKDWNQPLRRAIRAKVESVPMKEEKPKIKLHAIVPMAPMSMDHLPPMRSVKRPLTSWPVP